MTGRLEGRRVLVTGASSGIGMAIARQVAAEGGRVALAARSGDALAELADELPGEHVIVPVDLTELEEVGPAVTKAAEELGGLDAVVNAAGMAVTGGIRDVDPVRWGQLFDLNVVGLLAVTHAAIDHLVDNDVADIVNISSMSGRRRSSVEMGVYAASKHAVHVVSDTLREELGDDGVRVTTISPGFVRTSIFDGEDDDEVREGYREAMESKGLDPEVVAAQVVHALAQPAGVDLLEIALLSTDQ